jgi:hypothetical protein
MAKIAASETPQRETPCACGSNASTGGQVTFYGKPRDLKKNTSTGGSVGVF